MYPSGNLFIPVAHGRLEGILKEPPAGVERVGAALCLHPHPQHGGTMHNKVIFRAAAALNEAGLAALRINFRGVGLSSGVYNAGEGEQQDARDALAYLAARYPRQPLTVAGFSFGSRVGLRVGLADERVVRLIGIGVPARLYDYEWLKECRKPLLLVHGERDDIALAGGVRELVAGLPPEVPATLKIIAGAGHFFDTALDQLKQIITDWMPAH
jgi:alpha/beta superfamily hydrolase